MAKAGQLIINAEVKNEYGVFQLLTSGDKLLGEFAAPEVRAPVGAEQVRAILQELNLRHGIKSAAVKRIEALLGDGHGVSRIRIAEGTPSIPPEDGFLEILGEKETPPSDEKSEDVMAQGRGMGLHNVRAGEVIARLRPPVKGKRGQDVTGRPIEPAMPVDIAFRAGNHVVYDPSKRTFTSEVDGYLRVRQKAVHVEPVFHVEGSLDLTVGHIDFVGFVRVDGDVPDDYNVTGEKGIWVGGAVEAAQLSTEGNVEIVGGMAGKGRGTIQAKGEVSAHFLNDVTIETTGDVQVAREVLNCRVYTLGRVNVADATVVGGEVIALRGIHALCAGSQLDIPTWLIAGIDYRIRDELLSTQQKLLKEERRQQDLLNRAGQELTRFKTTGPTPTQRDEMNDLMSTIRNLQRQIIENRAKVEELREGFANQAVDCVSIGDKLFIGVKFTLGRAEGLSITRQDGPLSIVPAEDGIAIDIVPGLEIHERWQNEPTSGGRDVTD